MFEGTMVEKLSWKEFRAIGGLWFANRVLHLIGLAIVIEIDTETKEITDCYPARVKYRGFGHKSEQEGFIRVSEYLKENIDTLIDEAKE